MALIIDGYNLLHAAGIFGHGKKGGSLQRSREALIRFVAASVPPDQRLRTTIVFDAAGAPPGLPRETTHEGITVLYAANYEDADALIEELIAVDNAPRSLLVVSSDHRIQRAARRRRARFLDSDSWHTEMLRQRQRRGQSVPPKSKPVAPLTEDEVALWLAEFGPLTPEGPASQSPRTQIPTPQSPPTQGKGPDRPAGGSPGKPAGNVPELSPEDPFPTGYDPFPPGYGEDLL